jgi:hypothetical protein
MGLVSSAAPPAQQVSARLRQAALAWGAAAGRNHRIALLLCLILGFLFTLPGSLFPSSSLLGYPGDNFQHAWFLWHFARAVSHSRNPFYTRLLFYPSRVTLAWSTADPLAGLIALPLSLLAGPAVAYNLSLVLQLALSAFFARLLCLRISRNEPAAFIGGLIFGFSPFLLAHALGHLSLVTAFPIPLFVLALDRIFAAQNPSWKSGIPLGLALLLAAFAHYNYVVICVFFAFFWLLVERMVHFSSQRLRFLNRVWKPLAAGAATFLLGFSPLLWTMLGKRADIPVSRGPSHLDVFSADVLGFFIPSWNHIFLGRFVSHLNPRIFVAGFEGTVYVGVIVLALAAIGFWKGRSQDAPWAMRAFLLGLIFYLLSLGPWAHLLGHPLHIPGPAALFYLLPFAKFMSAPARFHVAVALCLAILGSLGVKFLLERTAKRSHRCWIVSLIAILVIADYLTIPFPRSSIADPGAPYSATAAGDLRPSAAQSCALPHDVRRGTVLTFPLVAAPYCLKSLWMQASDDGRFALVDGYLSYTPSYIWTRFWNLRILRSLFVLQGLAHAPIDVAADRKTVPAITRELNLRAILVYDSAQRDAAVRYVETVFDAQPQREGSCTVFPIDAARNAREPRNRVAPRDPRFAQ